MTGLSCGSSTSGGMMCDVPCFQQGSRIAERLETLPLCQHILPCSSARLQAAAVARLATGRWPKLQKLDIS